MTTEEYWELFSFIDQRVRLSPWQRHVDPTWAADNMDKHHALFPLTNSGCIPDDTGECMDQI